MSYRIIYLRGAVLEEAEEVSTMDLVEAAQLASSKHPDLTAEIWREEKKVAVCRPSWDHRLTAPKTRRKPR
jgi:hypothetical protein